MNETNRDEFDSIGVDFVLYIDLSSSHEFDQILQKGASTLLNDLLACKLLCNPKTTPKQRQPRNEWMNATQ